MLDGDQKGSGNAREPATHCMPLQSLEPAFAEADDQEGFQSRLPDHVRLPEEGRHKAIYKAILRLRLMTPVQTVEIACGLQPEAARVLAPKILQPFLSQSGPSHLFDA